MNDIIKVPCNIYRELGIHWKKYSVQDNTIMLIVNQFPNKARQLIVKNIKK